MAHFTKDEYGWPDVAVRNAVATLYAAGRVEIRKAGSLLEGTALAQALKVGRDMDKLVVAKVEAVSPERLASIKSSFRKLVGTNPVGGDAKSIAGEMVTLSRAGSSSVPRCRGTSLDISICHRIYREA